MGGAGFLQKRGARIVMSAADWDLMDAAKVAYLKPTRVTPDRPASFWFRQYGNSARRFRDFAGRADADVLLSNHTNFDGSKTKLPALRSRAAGAPHPYVMGRQAVTRYLTVAEECAQAGLSSSPR